MIAKWDDGQEEREKYLWKHDGDIEEREMYGCEQ